MKFSALSFAIITSFALTAPLALANQESDNEIESITVTGFKIKRSLQETTSSVAVITPEIMDQQQINSFTDAVVFTANTHGDDYGFSIRGIDGFNVSGGGNSYLASVYVDGAPLPASLIRTGAFSTWDGEQIEILRGPQSTLQGRNALAGAVILNTRQPTYDGEGRYRFMIGENGRQEAAFAVSNGLIEDQLAFRFSGEERRYDGTVKNLHNNTHSDESDDHTYRLKLLYEPAGLDDFTAVLSLMNAQRTYGDANLAIAEGQNPFKNRITHYNDTRERFIESDIISLNLNYDVAEGVSLSSHTTYSDVVNGFTWDSDYVDSYGTNPTIDTGSISLFDSEAKTLSQEFRLNIEQDNYNGVVGLYYFKLEQQDTSTGLFNYQLSRFGLSSSVLQAQYQLPEPIAQFVVSQYDAFNPAQTEVYSNLNSQVTSFAFFADGAYHINKQWDLFAGIRFDREQQENDNEAKYTILNSHLMPNPVDYIGTPYEAVAPLIGGINSMLQSLAERASVTAPLVDATFDTVLPKIGASYQFNKDINTSFTYQKGYRSGGVGINQARGEIFEYDPEYTDNYELSFRSSWLDNQFTVNANVFFLDWKDQQVALQLSPNNFDVNTVNAGKSEVKGLEIETKYLASDYLTMYASYGYTDTQFTDFAVNIVTNEGTIEYDLTGRRFAAPKHTGNIGLTYQGPEGILANINVSYAGDYPNFTNPYRDGLVEGDLHFDRYNNSRTLVDFQLGYEWETVGVYLVGKNVLDDEYYMSNRVRNPRLGNPREIGLVVRGSFDW